MRTCAAVVPKAGGPREGENLVLATYTEWQRGATRSEWTEAGRFTSVLMTRDAPHETWLPEAEQVGGSFDF